jgi:hypothetical protein
VNEHFAQWATPETQHGKFIPQTRARHAAKLMQIAIVNHVHHEAESRFTVRLIYYNQLRQPEPPARKSLN